MPNPNGTPENLLKGGKPGNKGGGRPKDRIRDKCLQGFEKHGLPYCLKVLSGEEQGDPLKAADMLGKYGGLTQVDVTSGDQPLKFIVGIDPEQV